MHTCKQYYGLKSSNRAHRQQLELNLKTEIRKYQYLDKEDIVFVLNMVRHQVKEDKL